MQSKHCCWIVYAHLISVYLSPWWFIHRHHTYKKVDHKNVDLIEVGPRFEMKRKWYAVVHHRKHIALFRSNPISIPLVRFLSNSLILAVFLFSLVVSECESDTIFKSLVLYRYPSTHESVMLVLKVLQSFGKFWKLAR